MFTTYWNDDMAEATLQEIKAHRGWYIFEGLLFLLVGFLAVIMPGTAVLAAELILATILLVGGIIRFFNGLFVRRQRWWRLISGLVYAIAGAMIWFWPLTSLSALLFVIGAMLLIEGVFDVGIALTMRPAKSWGWMLMAGVISFALGLFVFAGFPVTGIIYLAIILGVSFALYGGAILVLALRLGRDEAASINGQVSEMTTQNETKEKDNEKVHEAESGRQQQYSPLLIGKSSLTGRARFLEFGNSVPGTGLGSESAQTIAHTGCILSNKCGPIRKMHTRCICGTAYISKGCFRMPA